MHRTFKSILILSADTTELLRPVDVDRVMEAAQEMGILESFRAWLLGSNLKDATRKTVKIFEV